MVPQNHSYFNIRLDCTCILSSGKEQDEDITYRLKSATQRKVHGGFNNYSCNPMDNRKHNLRRMFLDYFRIQKIKTYFK